MLKNEGIHMQGFLERRNMINVTVESGWEEAVSLEQ